MTGKRGFTVEQGRFEALWGRSVGTDAAPAFAALERGYAEPHRRYHTAAHIKHCLRQFDLAAAEMDAPDQVELAIWFHDVIYRPGAGDNERRSADLLLKLMGERVAPELRAAVDDLIMVTVHPVPPRTADQRYVVDIDLSSFGLPWKEFLRDSVAVREEFPHLSDAEFYPGQCKFLEALIARPHFCYTEFFRARHEQRARDNIRGYLQALRTTGAPPAL